MLCLEPLVSNWVGNDGLPPFALAQRGLLLVTRSALFTNPSVLTPGTSSVAQMQPQHHQLLLISPKVSPFG